MSAATAVGIQSAPQAGMLRTDGARVPQNSGSQPVFRMPENLAHHKGRQVDVGKGFKSANGGRAAPGKGSQVSDARQQQAQQSARSAPQATRTASNPAQAQQATARGTASQNPTAENVASKQNAYLKRGSQPASKGGRAINSQSANNQQVATGRQASGTNIALKAQNNMVALKTALPKGTHSETHIRGQQDGASASKGDIMDEKGGRSQHRNGSSDDEQKKASTQAIGKSAQLLNARFSQTPIQSVSSSNAAQVEVVSTVLGHMERMRQSGQGAMVIDLPVAEGKSVRVAMRMTGNRISVRFEAPNEKIYQSLHEGWADLAEQAATRGIKLDSPIFTRGGDREEMEI